MTVSTKDGAYNSTWRCHISKRVRRIEVVFFLMVVAFLGFVFHVMESSQREAQEAKSSLLEMQNTISSLTNRMEVMEQSINEQKFQEPKIDISKPRSSSSSSSHHRAIVAPGDLPLTHFFIPRNNPINHVKDLSMSHREDISRKLQSENNSTQESDTGCDGKLFRLELELDEFPSETSITLSSEETGELFANLTFSDEEDAFANITYETCLDKGKYMLRILDAFADGISCFDSFDGLPCYDVFIDNELVIEGSPFQTAVREHTFDSNSLCVVNDLVMYTLHFHFGKMLLHGIFDFETQNEIEFLPVPNQDENTNSTSFYQCLTPAMKQFDLGTRKEKNCDGPCYSIYVNNELIIEGPDTLIPFELHSKRFFISIDHIGREQRCFSEPILTPINELSNYTVDDRVSKLLSVIQALSIAQDIFTPDSPQYKATCYILYDDPLQIPPEDSLLAQRYALAVFLHSTNERAELQLPLDECVNSRFTCNEKSDIDGINWSKYDNNNLQVHYLQKLCLTFDHSRNQNL